MQTLTYEEWEAEAKALFGDVKPRFWKFVCVNCGHVQSGAEMLEKYPDRAEYIQNSVFMSCEGRLDNKIKCDWTLGGLFQIHTREVISPHNGKSMPVFEFYKGDKK